MRLPPAPDTYQPPDQAALRRLLSQADDDNIKKRRDIVLANGEGLVLRSPNGSLWRLVVSNAGALSTVAYVP